MTKLVWIIGFWVGLVCNVYGVSIVDSSSLSYNDGTVKIESGDLTLQYSTTPTGSSLTNSPQRVSVLGITTVVNGDSDNGQFLPTQLAIKTYIDTAVETELSYLTDEVYLTKEEIIGMVFPFAVSTSFSMGDKWLECNGQAVDPADYPDLYARIGTVFGSSGSLFLVPDLKGRVAVGSGSGAIQNASAGAESFDLTTSNLPSHSHTVNDSGHTHSLYTYNARMSDSDTHTVRYFASSGSSSSIALDSATTQISVDNAGQSNPDNISLMKPYIVLRYFIRAKL